MSTKNWPATEEKGKECFTTIEPPSGCNGPQELNELRQTDQAISVPTFDESEAASSLTVARASDESPYQRHVRKQRHFPRYRFSFSQCVKHRCIVGLILGVSTLQLSALFVDNLQSWSEEYANGSAVWGWRAIRVGLFRIF